MPSLLAVLAAGVLAPASLGVLAATKVPSKAQVIDQKTFNVLSTVLPPVKANDTTVS